MLTLGLTCPCGARHASEVEMTVSDDAGRLGAVNMQLRERQARLTHASAISMETGREALLHTSTLNAELSIQSTASMRGPEDPLHTSFPYISCLHQHLTPAFNPTD